MERISDARLALLLLAPLLGFILSYLVGSRVRRLAGYIASAAIGLSFVLSCALFFDLPDRASFVATLGSWLTVGAFSMPLELVFDRLSAVMCLVVTGIGLLIHLFSIGYMSEDEGVARFFSYLNLFVVAMLLLVLGGNLPVVFIGWEGVGLCSYLLIGFWFTNREFTVAGRKAFVMNRIGDVGFIIAMMVLYSVCGTLELAAFRDPVVISKLKGTTGLVAGLALFFAATGKSAQIPLFTWLPDAMAGPTPVSALIHAATMVTAGIYLMARTSGIIELDAMVPATIIVTALATAFLAATVALAQTDIKKVLAYSTVSQLGFMFLAVGSGQYVVAIFHVVTHAFFKACLFLSAGSVIHGCHHEQDMREMGGLSKYMPITCAAYGVSTLAIAGVWPFAGFFSKHAILDGLAHVQNVHLMTWMPFINGVALLVATLTALYMGRSFVVTFLGSYRGRAHPHESPLVMTGPISVLAALSLVGGWFLSGRLFEYLSPLFSSTADHGHLTLLGILTGSLPGLVGLSLAVALFLFAPGIKESIRAHVVRLEELLVGKYFVDELFERVLVNPIRGIANLTYKVVDQGIVDGGVAGVGYVGSALGELTRRVTTGQVGTYVLLMFVAASVLLGIFVQR